MKFNNYSIEEIKEAISVSKSKREVLANLGISPKNSTAASKLNILIEEHNIYIGHFIAYKDFSVIDTFLPECKSFKDVGIKLGLTTKHKSMSSGNYTKIKNYISDNKLDISHFDDGGRYQNSIIRYNLENIFIENSKVTVQTLKRRYLKIREEKQESVTCCDSCGITKWMEEPIVLQLDHINGINDDNRLENLRLLCPNCHSQTTTFAGRRLKNIKKPMALSFKNKTPKIPKTPKNRKRFNPSKDELKQIVWTMPLTKVAIHYGVSDVAIAKRCKLLGIEKPPRGYWTKQK